MRWGAPSRPRLDRPPPGLPCQSAQGARWCVLAGEGSPGTARQRSAHPARPGGLVVCRAPRPPSMWVSSVQFRESKEKRVGFAWRITGHRRGPRADCRSAQDEWRFSAAMTHSDGFSYLDVHARAHERWVPATRHNPSLVLSRGFGVDRFQVDPDNFAGTAGALPGKAPAVHLGRERLLGARVFAVRRGPVLP